MGGRTIPSTEDAEDDIALALLLKLEGELEGLEGAEVIGQVGTQLQARVARLNGTSLRV